MIETKRLYLKPLTYNQLLKYIQGENLLEKELNLNSTSRVISPELKEALETSILPNVKDKNKNYLYYLCFLRSGRPSKEASVEPYSLLQELHSTSVEKKK